MEWPRGWLALEMVPMRAIVLGVFIAASGRAALAQPAAKPPPPSFAIEGVHAFLYFHGTGTFGDKDLTAGHVALWNTIIGEGDAGAPSTAMLVKVEIGGPSFANQDGKVVVVAKAGRKVLAKATFALSDYFDEHARSITLPLLVTGVGCDEVVVSASLSGKGKRGTATATVPFACGE